MNQNEPKSQPVRHAVVIDIEDLALPQVRVVVSAAVQVFQAGDPVEVVLALRGVDEPTEADAEIVQQLCIASVADPRALPEIVLLGASEAAGLAALKIVTAGADDVENARSVSLLTMLAREFWELEETPATSAPPAPVPDPESAVRLMVLEAQRDRARGEAAMSRRDVRVAQEVASGHRRPQVVLLVQQRQTWGSVSALCAELAARSDIEFVLAGIDTTADGQGASTVEFLREQGYDPRDREWLVHSLHDVDVLVVDNPYDEFRPAELRATALAERGVRLVSVPYGCNAIDGEFMNKLLWDLPLQRLAWRAYLPSYAQAKMYAAHCAAGDAPVRVLGSPKLDPTTGEGAQPRSWGRRVRARAKGRPVVLWNPHFRMGTGGWSTFHLYLEPMLDRFMERSDLVLLLRPHFRLFADMAAQEGVEQSRLERTIRRIAAERENVVLDDSADYNEALATADAMMSDLSSLATVFLPSGKPLLYLRREDGPGTNAEGAYFESMYQATSWTDVERFLVMLKRSEDPQAEQRTQAVREHFPLADGLASQRIADDIVRSFYEELSLPELVAPLQAGRLQPELRAG